MFSGWHSLIAVSTRLGVLAVIDAPLESAAGKRTRSADFHQLPRSLIAL